MLGLLAGAAAQAQPAGIRFEETVRLVEVPVWVLGSGGEPVTDLAAAEFSLKEDGKDQEIAFFELLDYDRTTPQTLRFPRQYLFLFDTMFSEPFAIIRARRAAIDFLDRAWGPNDVAAVAMVTAREGVKLVCNFTSDRRVLGAALETLGYAGWTSDVRGPSSFALLTQSPAGGGRTTTGERGGREELSELRDGIDQDIADHIRQQEGQAQIADFRRYKQFAGELFSTLDRLGTGLRAMQGVKHVVYFSQPRQLRGRRRSDDAGRQLGRCRRRCLRRAQSRRSQLRRRRSARLSNQEPGADGEQLRADPSGRYRRPARGLQ
jgi:VWFA-related protein